MALIRRILLLFLSSSSFIIIIITVDFVPNVRIGLLRSKGAWSLNRCSRNVEMIHFSYLPDSEADN